MAGDWIKVRMDLHDDPAVIAIACRVGLSEDEVVGKLVRFWSWASRHTTDGNADSVTEMWLDRYVGVTGMARAMAQEGWLVLKEGGGITIPRFDRHNGDPAKKRAMTRLRVQKHREKMSDSCNAVSVTKALPEKRREEKNIEEPPIPPKGGGSRKKPAEMPNIPPELNAPVFLEAWGEWLAYRAERKPRVTPLSAAQAFRELAPHGPEVAAQAIRHSIARGYQGVFLAPAQQKQPPPANTPVDRIALFRARQAEAEAARKAQAQQEEHSW